MGIIITLVVTMTYSETNDKGDNDMIKIPRGTQDILPEDSIKWRHIENKLDELMELYNYKRNSHTYI